ncbi:MAG: SatD family protein [Eubacteriales bacterium]
MFFNNTTYIAIIGDIKNSREIENREFTQNRLKNILSDINDKYISDIASKFTITLGDEFQGLLHDGRNTISIITEIENTLFPVCIRFGIGIGGVSTEINQELAIGADGPCYYNARSAIEYIKNSENKNKVGITDIRLSCDYNTNIINIVNTVFSLITVIKRSWSTNQRQVIWDMLQYNESQTRAANRMGISQSSIQKALTGGHYYEYKTALEDLSDILSKLRSKDV